MTHKHNPVGVVGLGALGSALAKRLIDSGYAVIGYDVSEKSTASGAALGVTIAGSPADVGEKADVVVLSLPSSESLSAVTEGVNHVASRRPDGCVIDTSTFSVDTKRSARANLHKAGWQMLDCTVSGNREMVLGGDHVLFVSGDSDTIERCREVLSALSERTVTVGDFGKATMVKLIINHLVIIHGAAAAEAAGLAATAGLDLPTIFELVTRSAGNSKIFELRTRRLIDEDYLSSQGSYAAIGKDAGIIQAWANGVRFPVPLLALANQMYMVGVAGGWQDQDPASLGAALRKLVVN